MGLEHEYDKMIEQIKQKRDLPIEKQKEINLHLILTVEEAVWVSRRIYEEVERGIFTAKLDIKQSEHSIDLFIGLLLLAAGTAVVTITKRTVNHLFDDLEDYLERKKRKSRKKVKN